MSNEKQQYHDDMIWIELPEPIDDEHKKQICDKANAMLAKLNVDYRAFAPNTFTRRTNYIFWQSKHGGFLELEDNGQWLSLEYLTQ